MKTFGIIVYTVIVLAISRLIPHPPNFTPILAMAVTMPMLTSDRYMAVVIPLLAMFVSDIFIGFHSYMFWVYTSFIAVTLMSYMFMKQFKFVNVWIMSLLSSLLFFIVTNFGVWTSGYYGYTLTGLITCYIMAIPFFTNTVLSTLFYSTIIKTLYEVKEKWPLNYRKLFY